MKKIFFVLTLIAFLFLLTVGSYFAFTQVADNCTTQNFSDRGLRLEIEYPCEWKLNLNTRISEDFIFDDEQEIFAPVAENYELTFSNNDSEVTFKKFLQAGDGSIRSFDEDSEYKVISAKIVRYKTDEVWTYVEYYSCEDVPEVFRNGAEDCGGSFFPAWGRFATVVSTSENDAEELKEIDELVIGVYGNN